MEMEVGLLVAIGIVLEQRHGEIASLHGPHLPVFDETRFCRILLGPLERFHHGLAVGLNDPLVAADEGEDRPALWQGKGQIGAGSVLVFVTDPGAIRKLALEELVEDCGIDFSRKAKGFGS